MKPRSMIPVGFLLPSLSFLCLTGCSQVTAPLHFAGPSGTQELAMAGNAKSEDRRRLFYPLVVGNHWSYERRFALIFTPTGGSPGTPFIHQSTLEIDLIGTEERFGREYVVQRERERAAQGDHEFRFLYRQDASGLYNADPEVSAASDRILSLDEAPTEWGPNAAAIQTAMMQVREKSALIRAAALHGAQALGANRGGPRSGEITLLQYPLHADATWHVREDPLVIYTVESHETLQEPAGVFPAWRIRIDWPQFFGPADRARVWYGRSGLIELEVHVESKVTDSSGQEIGTIVSDESQRLLSVSAAGHTAP